VTAVVGRGLPLRHRATWAATLASATWASATWSAWA